MELHIGDTYCQNTMKMVGSEPSRFIDDMSIFYCNAPMDAFTTIVVPVQQQTAVL